MISLYITKQSSTRLYAEIENKVGGIKELTTVATKHQLVSAAFSIGALKFIKRTNILSRSLGKSFHHVYDWNQLGMESGRLFRIIKRQETGGHASIYYKFNNSRKRVPIAPELKSPGKTGKVVNRSSIFKRKAEVMENGKPASFVTSRTIAFSNKGRIIFVHKGKTINIKNPGGKDTTGSFEAHFRSWWMANFPLILDNSGVTKKLEKILQGRLIKIMLEDQRLRLQL